MGWPPCVDGAEEPGGSSIDNAKARRSHAQTFHQDENWRGGRKTIKVSAGFARMSEAANHSCCSTPGEVIGFSRFHGMNAFWIAFEMLRINSASWAEVSENGGDDHAQQAALWEAITCKFNSGYAGIPKSGPLPKAAVVQIVDLMIAEQQKRK